MPAAEGDGALAGQMLGPYRMERQLGRGGMGVVYLAEDTRLGRKVAVKILPKEFSADNARKDRLRLEARAAAALSHPAIATVFSLEELDGRLCLVSEYVRGDTLRAELDHGPFSLDLLIDTGIQVARGLAAAHAAGVIHRDLKPDNVIRSIQGEVKILDFGIAHLDAPGTGSSPRLTAVGQIIGTPGYMSPEQLDGADVDPRADVFALGVLLFELATAAHPFAGPTPAATIANVYAANPPQLNGLDGRLPPQLDAIVRKCVRRNRGERYSSALDVASDLQDLRDGRLRAPARAGGRRRCRVRSGGGRSTRCARSWSRAASSSRSRAPTEWTPGTGRSRSSSPMSPPSPSTARCASTCCSRARSTPGGCRSSSAARCRSRAGPTW